eukprot:gene13092-biopygen12528
MCAWLGFPHDVVASRGSWSHAPTHGSSGRCSRTPARLTRRRQ